MPGNARKKEKLGGVSGGKEKIAHYAWCGREKSEEAKPCLVGQCKREGETQGERRKPGPKEKGRQWWCSASFVLKLGLA